MQPFDIEPFDYSISGYENQVLQLQLQPGQRIQAEKGAMTCMDEHLEMQTTLGEKTGIFGALKRRVSGESILINEFHNPSEQSAYLVLSPQRPSHIVSLNLALDRPDLICRPDTFLAGHTSVKVSITRGAWGPAMLAAGNLIMQRLHGEGHVFITGNGAVLQRYLGPEQTLVADQDAVIAFDDSVSYRAGMIKGLANKLWGGESIIIVTATGPGNVWLQSLSRFEVAESHMRELIRKESKILNQRR